MAFEGIPKYIFMLSFRSIYSHKRFPLRISRGVREGSTNLYVAWENDGITGWGEAVPGESEGAGTAEECQHALSSFWREEYGGLSIFEIYRRGRSEGVPSCALAGLETALWDHKAKKAGLPLHELLGLPLPNIPTSVTVGINPPEVVAERIPLLLNAAPTGVLKIKLGSPDGIEADMAMFEQVVESCKPWPQVRLRVDANGGWSVVEARTMMQYLADRGVEYIEQPLKEGQEDGLSQLYAHRPLPIFADESCRYSEQIPGLANHVDGVNLKLMKCGGIIEAMRIIATARAHGLKTMIGCMSESSIGIAAAASISGITDHIDLDSHLNLKPDPAAGCRLERGVVLPGDMPGHGAWLRDTDHQP